MRPIEFTVSVEEWVAYQLFWLEKSGRLKQLVRTRRVAAAVFSAAFVAFMFLSNEDALTLGVSVVFAVGFLAYFGIRTKAQVVKSHQKAARSAIKQQAASLLLPQTVQAFPGSVEITTAHETTRLEKAGIVEIAESPESLYLFRNEHNAYIVPKRIFQDEAECLEFLRLLRADSAS